VTVNREDPELFVVLTNFPEGFVSCAVVSRPDDTGGHGMNTGFGEVRLNFTLRSEACEFRHFGYPNEPCEIASRNTRVGVLKFEISKLEGGILHRYTDIAKSNPELSFPIRNSEQVAAVVILYTIGVFCVECHRSTQQRDLKLINPDRVEISKVIDNRDLDKAWVKTTHPE
jgi:hypothetical protein